MSKIGSIHYLLFNAFNINIHSIFYIRTSFFMVYDDIEKPQTLLVTSRVENTACSGDRVQKITGRWPFHRIEYAISS